MIRAAPISLDRRANAAFESVSASVHASVVSKPPFLATRAFDLSDEVAEEENKEKPLQTRMISGVLGEVMAKLDDVSEAVVSAGSKIAESSASAAHRVQLPDLNEPWPPPVQAGVRLAPVPQPADNESPGIVQTQASLDSSSHQRPGDKRSREQFGAAAEIQVPLPAKRPRGRPPRPIPAGSTPEAEAALKAYDAATRQRRKGKMTLEEVRKFRDVAMSFPPNRLEHNKHSLKSVQRARSQRKNEAQYQRKQEASSRAAAVEVPTQLSVRPSDSNATSKRPSDTPRASAAGP